MTVPQLKAHYGVGENTITRWRKLTGIVRMGPVVRALPEDFARLANYKTRGDLAKHYAVSADTVTRWRRAAGLPRFPVTSAVHFRGPGLSTALTRGRRDETLAGRAVDHLRRYGPVYRCREDGEPDFAGRFWNRGGHVLTDDDVIQRARRLGFDPDDWKRLASEPSAAPLTTTKGL
ncbi:hypothetical protein LZK98_11450 [Sphingomonas cannabina]|uniref:hypothetical protein n=1 Tax=Sphingomonas cannabina TaxID=2899123 RepID=UPI001F30A681|nr:hypothetical protein [Sphingomonas cannabina]UIJ43705.1 hypothetical protein LZK98_11450 [Sphingomonas cannabina]